MTFLDNSIRYNPVLVLEASSDDKSWLYISPLFGDCFKYVNVRIYSFKIVCHYFLGIMFIKLVCLFFFSNRTFNMYVTKVCGSCLQMSIDKFEDCITCPHFQVSLLKLFSAFNAAAWFFLYSEFSMTTMKTSFHSLPFPSS